MCALWCSTLWTWARNSRRYIQCTCQLLAQVMDLAAFASRAAISPERFGRRVIENRIFLWRCADGSREMPTWSSSAYRDVGRLQAIADCLGRKTRTVLLAVEAFFLYGRDKLTIFYDRGRGIAVVSVNPQNVQRTNSFPLSHRSYKYDAVPIAKSRRPIRAAISIRRSLSRICFRCPPRPC